MAALLSSRSRYSTNSVDACTCKSRYSSHRCFAASNAPLARSVAESHVGSAQLLVCPPTTLSKPQTHVLTLDLVISQHRQWEISHVCSIVRGVYVAERATSSSSCKDASTWTKAIEKTRKLGTSEYTLYIEYSWFTRVVHIDYWCLLSLYFTV